MLVYRIGNPVRKLAISLPELTNPLLVLPFSRRPLAPIDSLGLVRNGQHHRYIKNRNTPFQIQLITVSTYCELPGKLPRKKQR